METVIEYESSEREAKDISVDLTFRAPEKLKNGIRIPVVEVYRGAGIDLLKCIIGSAENQQDTKIRHLAYLEIDKYVPGGVQVKPIVDSRKVLLASLAFVMWIGLWLSIVWWQYIRLSKSSESDAANSA